MPAGNSGHVLMVDDQPLNLKLLATVLGSRGFVTTQALSGEQALAAAERVRRAMMSTGDAGARVPPLTISIGVAQYDKSQTLEALVHKADTLLYKAKRSGRDRVEA
jgi:diguanylate cyclase (GGDEF)-like protein